VTITLYQLSMTHVLLAFHVFKVERLRRATMGVHHDEREVYFGISPANHRVSPHTQSIGTDADSFARTGMYRLAE
jgi:hypothetical protein